MKILPHVSVVIPTWNRKMDLLECLESVGRIDYPKKLLKVIVIDNYSIDGTSEAVRERFPNVLLIKLLENKGLGGAINIGIRQTLDKYIFILDSDVIVDSKALKELVSVMEKNPKIGFAGGKMFEYVQKNKIQAFYGTINLRTFDSEQPYVGEKDVGQVKDIKFSDIVPFGCALARRSALKKIGYMDERYFVYFDDIDLLVSLKKAGYLIAFVPKAISWHKRTSTHEKDKGRRVTYYLLRNKLLIRKKFNTLTFYDHYKNLQFLLLTTFFSFFGSREKRVDSNIAVRAIVDFYTNKVGVGSIERYIKSLSS